MKKTTTLLLLFISCIANAQTVLKANATALLGYPQIGLETTLGENTTFQIDALASLWKSFNGGPHEIYVVVPEFRYYPRKALSGFYFGVHVGGAKYRFQKWNYQTTNSYQEGYSVLYGGTFGYQLQINDRISLEAFLGGGSQQGYYKGYKIDTGERYDSAKNYNKSGEWLPYRGGLMIIYKLGMKSEK